MMKRTIAFLICAVMLLSTAVLAFADDLPSINSAIKGKKTKNKKTEVSDTLKDYKPLIEDTTNETGNSTIIILERQMPKKEFSEVTYENGEISPYEGGFPDNYQGVDKGKIRVWYRGDLMKNIKSSYKGKSLSKTALLVIAENYYVKSGTISTYQYEGGTSQIPEFASLEEMQIYLMSHKQTIKSISYYPVFGVYTFVTVYSTRNKKIVYRNGKFTDVNIDNLVKNAAAFNQWNNMKAIATIIDMLQSGSHNKSTLRESIDNCSFVDDNKKSVWRSCINASEWGDALDSITKYYWQMAEKLKSLDPSENNKSNYDLIIEGKSIEALIQFVGFCNYAGLKKSISEIRESGDYIATMDTEWQKQKLNEFLKQFKK